MRETEVGAAYCVGNDKLFEDPNHFASASALSPVARQEQIVARWISPSSMVIRTEVGYRMGEKPRMAASR